MVATALDEQQLRRFLWRRRRAGALVQPPPLGRFLAGTLDLAARMVPSQAGSLLLDDPTRPRGRSALTFVAAFGPAADRLLGMQVPRGHGVVGEVYKNTATYSTSRVASDPHFFADVDVQAGFRTRSLVAAPVLLEGTVCGVFELVNRRGRKTFSERDVELVELISEYVSRAILNAVDILKQNELALRDDLTDLRNARGLESDLEAQIVRAARSNSDVAVLYVDVDRLKRLNDRHGHRAGSEALRRIGRGINEAVGTRGVSYRLGGDEFVVICPDADLDGATRIADDVRQTVAQRTPGPMRWGGQIPGMTVSIGVATLRATLALRTGRRGPRRSARLLTAADRALYRAKRAGRNRNARATRRDDTLGREAG